MSSLRESVQMELYADTFLLMYREDDDDPHSRRVLMFPKNKEGEIGLMHLDFDGTTQTFSESDGDTRDEEDSVLPAPEYLQDELQAVTTRRRGEMRR